jgi:hypothetical protein
MCGCSMGEKVESANAVVATRTRNLPLSWRSYSAISAQGGGSIQGRRFGIDEDDRKRDTQAQAPQFPDGATDDTSELVPIEQALRGQSGSSLPACRARPPGSCQRSDHPHTTSNRNSEVNPRRHRSSSSAASLAGSSHALRPKSYGSATDTGPFGKIRAHNGTLTSPRLRSKRR